MKWHANIGTAPLLLLITERRKMLEQRERKQADVFKNKFMYK